MNDILNTLQDRDSRLENFAAELTYAVHLLLLQRGRKDSWLDLELDVWSFNDGAKRFFARHGFEIFNERFWTP